MSNNLIETEYRPDSLVKASLDLDTFKNPSAGDRRHFFRSEGCSIPELQQAISSTVLVSETSGHPGGSGVIVTFDGKKYIITATHVIGNLLAGEYSKDIEKYHYRDIGGVIKEGLMTRDNMLYDSTTARKRGLQATDVAIFTFDGDNQGIEISDQDVSTNQDQIGVAIGFPGDHHEDWKESIKPLLSIGTIFKDKHKEFTPYMREFMEKVRHERGEKEGQDLNVYFTGQILPGNSGGPLVDTQGKPIAVCHGPKGTVGRENGIERFSDFRPILKAVVSNDRQR